MSPAPPSLLMPLPNDPPPEKHQRTPQNADLTSTTNLHGLTTIYCRFGICLPHPKTTTCHHQPSAMTHTFAWHSQHKTSIQQVSTTCLLGCPGVTMEFGTLFCKDEKKKKCAQILLLPPGTLADMLYLPVVCLFCAVSARQRHESSLS